MALPTFSFGPQNWAKFLSGLGSALSSRGRGGTLGEGMATGLANYDQSQQNAIAQQMAEERLKLEQEASEARRTEASRKAAQDRRWEMLFGDTMAGVPMKGGPVRPDMPRGVQTASGSDPMSSTIANLPPNVRAALSQMPAEQGQAALVDYLLKMGEPLDAPTVKDFYEGGELVQKQWNGKEWVEVGRGARFAPDRGGTDKTSLVPFYAKGPDGKLRMYQPTASGKPVEVQLPEGFTPAPGVQYLDTGTAFVPVDKRGAGEPGAAIPKDVAGEAAAKESGKLQGEAQINLTGVRENVRFIKQTLNQIRNHPGRTAATGGSSVLNLVAVPGSDRRDFLAKAGQLRGQAFLQAYESLRGGGQITEVEGAKAEAARVALDNAQSEEQYLQALDDFEREVDALVKIAEQKAGSAPSPLAPAGANPPTRGRPNYVDKLEGPGWQ